MRITLTQDGTDSKQIHQIRLSTSGWSSANSPYRRKRMMTTILTMMITMTRNEVAIQENMVSFISLWRLLDFICCSRDSSNHYGTRTLAFHWPMRFVHTFFAIKNQPSPSLLSFFSFTYDSWGHLYFCWYCRRRRIRHASSMSCCPRMSMIHWRWLI
jgi:hypothetical protein